MKFLLILSSFLSRQTSAFIALVGIISFFVPKMFNWVRGNVQTSILGVIMLAMGMTLSKKDFRILAQRPFDICVGAVAQYTIMPLLAFFVCKALKLPTGLVAGLILVGSSPGGVSSNIMSFLCKGDVAFSVGMTTVSTLLSPILTPLLVLHLAGERIDVDALGMFKSILYVTILPVSLGFVLNEALGRTRSYRYTLSLMPGIAVVGLACIVGGVVSAHGDSFLKAGGVLFLAVLIHNFGGYALGFMAATITRMNKAKRRTLSIEVGMQNAGLATVLASKHFASLPDAAIISAVSCVWHSISGALLAGLFVLFDRKLEKH